MSFIRFLLLVKLLSMSWIAEAAAPVAKSAEVMLPEDQSISIPLQASDADPRASLTYFIKTKPAHGTLSTPSASGVITYTPTANFFGKDHFVFYAKDKRGYVSNNAIVAILVTPINDTPTATLVKATTDEDTTVMIELKGSDIEKGFLTYSLSDVHENEGSVSILHKYAIFTPKANYNGPASFSYVVSDGSLTSLKVPVLVTVTAINDAPSVTDLTAIVNQDASVMIPLSGTDVEGTPLMLSTSAAINGTVSLTANMATFTPTAGFNGEASFEYAASDGEKTSATAKVTVTVLPKTTYDFTGSIPVGVTNTDCEVSGGSLHLSQNSDGTYVDECNIEIPVTVAQASDKFVTTEATSYDILEFGDFVGVTSDTISLHTPKSDAYKVAKAAGSWYSSASWPGLKPKLTTGSDGTQDVIISGTGNLEQIFKIEPGEEFALSFTASTASTGDETLFLGLTYYDKNFKALKFTYPVNDTTVSSLSAFRTYKAATDDLEEEFLIRMMDCEDFTKYHKGDGLYPDDVIFNMCEDASGNPQTNEDGTAYTVNDIAYAGISFNVNYNTVGETATLKTASIKDMNPIHISVIDSSGAVIQESSNANELYVESLSTDATLRITLRTLSNSKTPEITSLDLDDAIGATVETSSTVVEEFTKARMGATLAIPPTTEWVDRDDLRSECLDDFDGGTALNCWEFLTKYGINRMRYAIPSSYFKTTLSGTTYSFEFRDGFVTNKMEAGTLLRRFAEANAYGMDILMIVEGSCEGQYWWDGGWQDCYWDKDGNLNAAFDPTPNDTSDNVANEMELYRQYTVNLATIFDGTHQATFSTGTIDLPKIDNFQIGVETNIAQAIWYNNFTDAEEMAFLADQAAAIKGVNPSANVQTSVNPENSSTVQAYPYDYLESILSGVDPTNYTHFNYNTFNDGYEVKPEDWLTAWPALQSKTYFSGWKDKKLSVGAFDYPHSTYDPYPDCNQTTWDRRQQHGIAASSKLMARMLLTNLTLPNEDIYDYTLFSGEGYYGGNITYHECWRSGASMGNIFDRVTDSGSLSGKDEPTQYKLNAEGVSYITIAKNLSISSPYATNVDSNDTTLHATLFKDKDGGKILALWQRDPYKYGADYMSYMSGQWDNGYTSKRAVSVRLKDVSTVSATLIRLDGSSEESLTVTASGSDTVISNVVLDGDMPVLIQL